MSRLRDYREGNDNETLLNYFAFLTAETASEFMVQQNTYHSNKQAAKQQSNFVEELKQDTLIEAFKEYLNQAELDLLLKPDKLTKTDHTSKIPDATNATIKISRPWFYMVLHLMPCEFINHIALEIKKHHVLTQGDNYSEIYTAISLYLDVHNSELDIKSLSDDDKLPVFYEDKQQFKNLFEQNKKDDKQNQLIPVRGLREILRYGNIQQLEKLFVTSKVSDADIEKLKALQENGENSEISIAQQEREKLHATLVLVKSKQKISDGDKKLYQKYLQTITNYRRLKNHVYLHNPKQAHQLIMAVSARLLGFSQLWERDIYFVLLALLFLRNIKVNQIEIQPDFIKLIKKGQIIPAFDALERVEAEIIKTVVDDIQKLFSINDSQNGYSNRDTRNNLAHFKTLRSHDVINFTQQINHMRRMMRYDRKNKNAVSRAMIDLLARYNLVLKFDMLNHQLVFNSLIPQKIYHFENRDITEKLHDNAYVGVIKKLFSGVTNGKQLSATRK